MLGVPREARFQRRFRHTLRVVARILIGTGWIWLAGALAVIGYAYVTIGIDDGFGRIRQLLNPTAVINWLVVLAALAPGVVMVYCGRRLHMSQQRHPS